MQSTSRQMLEEILNIRKSLAANFSTAEDGYTKKMFRFSADAEEQLRDVRDGILSAEKLLRDVQNYYCEGEEMARPMQSQDFFGIFRTFTSSYKVSSGSVKHVQVANDSSVERQTGLDKQKLLSENVVSKLVPPSHPRSLVNPKVEILLKLASTDSGSKVHPESSENVDNMHLPSHLWRPIQISLISSFQWARMEKISISVQLP
jgi:hypothetical protein